MTTEEKWHIAIGTFFICLFIFTIIGYSLRIVNKVALYVAPVLLAMSIILIMSFMVKKYRSMKFKYATTIFITIIVTVLLCIVIYTMRQTGIKEYFLLINDKIGIISQAVILALISLMVLSKKNRKSEKYVKLNKAMMIKGLFLFISITVVVISLIIGLTFVLNKYLSVKMNPAAVGGITDILIVVLVVIAIAVSRRK